MVRFWDREADVLVSTTIIESGLDVPNANTLIVDRADALGLAQMYQLRGRVGRSAERAFAYFFFAPQREMTDDARERLATISTHQALGSGFQIALRDLEIRGAGNVLGAEQHGHIAAVGFDAYARILQESMAEMKGEAIPRGEGAAHRPAGQGVHPAGLGGAGGAAARAVPPDLARRRPRRAGSQIRDETVDRYGALPDQVETLFAVASLRVTCRALGVEEVTTFAIRCGSRPSPSRPSCAFDLQERVYRRHPPRDDADAEPGPGPGVRRGPGALRGAVAAGGRHR